MKTMIILVALFVSMLATAQPADSVLRKLFDSGTITNSISLGDWWSSGNGIILFHTDTSSIGIIGDTALAVKSASQALKRLLAQQDTLRETLRAMVNWSNTVSDYFKIGSKEWKAVLIGIRKEGYILRKPKRKVRS